MKSIINYLLFVFLIVALYGVSFSFGQTEDLPGKKIFVDSKCGMCHTVTSAGLESKKKDAVDLSSAGTTHNAEFLKKFLTKTEKINDKEHKTAFKGDDESLSALVLWLESLKETETIEKK